MDMIKYISVEWPEYQIFMEHPRFREECYYCPDSSMYFIPEDLYDEVMNPPYELPEEYNNFTTKFSRIKKGQNVLVLTESGLLVTKATSNWKEYESFPVILEEKGLLDGINCEVIAIEKESI